MQLYIDFFEYTPLMLCEASKSRLHGTSYCKLGSRSLAMRPVHGVDSPHGVWLHTPRHYETKLNCLANDFAKQFVKAKSPTGFQAGKVRKHFSFHRMMTRFTGPAVSKVLGTEIGGITLPRRGVCRIAGNVPPNWKPLQWNRHSSAHRKRHLCAAPKRMPALQLVGCCELQKNSLQYTEVRQVKLVLTLEPKCISTKLAVALLMPCFHS